jgi:hypothetical protein
VERGSLGAEGSPTKTGDAAQLMATLRRTVQREMPGASYITVVPFSEIVGRQMQSWRG